MLAFQPHNSSVFPCPACGHAPTEVKGTLWQGIHLLGDCVCDNCGLNFYHTFPIKHARHFPLAFAKNQRQTFVPPGVGPWLYQPLFDSYYSGRKTSVPIRKIVCRKYAKAVILNCLDYLYGHVLLQLLNAQTHLETTPGIGLIVIVPKNLTWLVPESVAEIWEVDAPLSAFKNRIENLDAFVKGELTRFEEVYLSEAFIQPDWNAIDISLFTKTQKFNLDDFHQKPFQITFLWREDRCWLNTKPEDFLWKAAFKLKLIDRINFYFLWRQKRLFVKTARLIGRQQAGVRFAVAGIGQRQRFPAFFQDCRQAQPDTVTEQLWCRLYAESHLVIGVHGSGLLLPSALAAGFIELLPRHRLANFGEGTATNYADRRQAFLGRFLDIFAKPELVAAHAVQMLKGFGFFRQVLEKGNNL